MNHLICLIKSLVVGVAIVSSATADSPLMPGDRIAIVGNTFADQLRIHGYLETKLTQHWPSDPVSVRNLGWAGDLLTSRDRPTGFPSEEQTLTEHRTDVIIACFGMGESFAGENGLASFRDSLRAFIQTHSGKRYNGNTEVRLVLVSPIAHEQLGKITPNQPSRDRELALYSETMGEVAKTANIPFVNLYQPSRYLMNETKGPKLTTNGIHLTPYGYWAVSHFMFRDLVDNNQNVNQQPWQLYVDAANESMTQRGVRASKLSRIADGLEFQVTELVAPTLPPPSDDELPPQLVHLRDAMTVLNLEPGKYELKVDGQSVVTASHQAWADGVSIDQSPAHQESESLRDRINDKNLQFTYSWKALNQVHIVGERKKSPSGRALPAEVIKFNQLAIQRDAETPTVVQRKTRNWQLLRVKE